LPPNHNQCRSVNIFLVNYVHDGHGVICIGSWQKRYRLYIVWNY
jgi:hypothetical protein